MERLVSLGGNSASESGPAWYCVRSQPKHEYLAAVHVGKLERVEVFCPRVRFKRPTRQGLVWVTEAMFPGYLFARFELAEMHRQVQYAPGVRVILRFGQKYPTVDDATLARLREHTGSTEIKVVDQGISEGDQVTVNHGAFVGLEAVVTRVLPAGQRVKILMDFFGRQMEAEIQLSNVLPRVVHILQS